MKNSFYNSLSKCNLCPRNCGVNRFDNSGVCGANSDIYLAHYSLHEWEEPIISGKNGSGTVFFSHCNLKCIFCQNRQISLEGYGKKISIEQLREIFLIQQSKGAHNINLVTPTHYAPQIIEALKPIRHKELNIPIVYNTSSYENVSTIKNMKDYIDIYLADLKYYDDNLAKKYSKCTNYFEYASAAIDEMYKQVGAPIIEDGLMKKGLIVRILILPDEIEDAKKIVKYLYEKYGDNIIISLMNQYTPVVNFKNFNNLNRKLTVSEYDDVINYACDLGVTNAFIQEGNTSELSFIPKFDCTKF